MFKLQEAHFKIVHTVSFGEKQVFYFYVEKNVHCVSVVLTWHYISHIIPFRCKAKMQLTRK